MGTRRPANCLRASPYENLGGDKVAPARTDRERHSRIVSALRDANLDAFICSLPSNVLLLSGYWPVMGTTVAIFTNGGEVYLLAPEDEAKAAAASSSAQLTVFKPASLKEITTSQEAIVSPLQKLVRKLGLEGARIGVETGAAMEPAAYLALHLYGDALGNALRTAFANLKINPADALFNRMKSVKTADEMGKIRISCQLATLAFTAAAPQLEMGMHETEAVALFQSAFARAAASEAAASVKRSYAYFFCMSGPNSALAAAAYARTRKRKLERGDLVMIHCNSCADGYWTDLTRTYTLQPPDKKQMAMRQAVLKARTAAFAAIRPAVRAADVDKAARGVLAADGFGVEFKHATGHGVGFSAANHNAVPRVHPLSQDALQPGMSFNVEPAIYFDDYGGIRHCDMASVSATGAEALTEFQSDPESLTMGKT